MSEPAQPRVEWMVEKNIARFYFVFSGVSVMSTFSDLKFSQLCFFQHSFWFPAFFYFRKSKYLTTFTAQVEKHNTQDILYPDCECEPLRTDF